MVVQHNLRAMNSNRMLGLVAGQQSKSTEKLSSGYKINRAADDAAGLSISEKMRKQIRGLSQASLNAADGISAVQTAEGALNEVQDMLQRMNELAVKAANGTMSEDDRGYIQDEIDQLVTEIDRVAETTKFNETYLLKGSGDKSATIKAEATIGTATNAGTLIAATGNVYEGKVVSTLSPDTEETATITYVDGEGNTRIKDVTFKTGASAEVTTKNLAEAIEKDAELGKVFKASGNEIGKLTVESKLDGNKTDDTKNKVTTIAFKSTNAAGLDTEIKGVTTKAAASETYEFTLTDAAGATLLASGNSITIDGKTYTYDPDKASTTDAANTFKTLDDLQALLGDDYTVTADLQLELIKIPDAVPGDTDYDAGAASYTEIEVTKLDTIAAAIQKVSTQRSALGAVQNRLEHTIANLDNVVENTTAAESQIRDTDMATEMVKFSNTNISAQAGQATLAQANQANQGVLSLLG